MGEAPTGEPLVRLDAPASRCVALETTLLAHGVPRAEAAPLDAELREIVRAEGAAPALIGVLRGRPVVGIDEAELGELLGEPDVAKLNTPNLGLALHRRRSGATTVSATMELAARAGVRTFATGGIGGVHHGLARRLDVSADLGALTRFPVAVVCSGVKSIIDVESTREALETLGVPVVGFGTAAFPAFYLRASDASVDERFDDVDDLAAFVDAELRRTGRGLVVANPIPRDDELDPDRFTRWLAEASEGLERTHGRDVSPRLLARLHELSRGRTLGANLALVRANARLAARIAARLRVD